MPVIAPGPTQADPPGSGPRLVATADPGSHPPSVALQVAGMPSGTTSLRITRVDPDGRQRPVRQAEPLRIGAGGTGSCRDVEMPHNALVRYRVGSAGLVTPPVQVDTPDIWLIDPGTPTSSVRFHTMDLLELGGREYGVRVVVSEVAGSEEPTITVMGTPTASPTSSLRLRTDTEAHAAVMRSLVKASRTVLLQVPRYAGQRPLWEYVFLTSRGEQPVARGLKPAVVWPLSYRVVARPEGAQNTAWDWSEAEDTFDGWDQLTEAYPGGWADFTADRRAIVAP